LTLDGRLFALKSKGIEIDESDSDIEEDVKTTLPVEMSEFEKSAGAKAVYLGELGCNEAAQVKCSTNAGFQVIEVEKWMSVLVPAD
jgi:hypothetical protein